MLASRLLDEHCQRAIDDGEAYPHFHAGIGQEALSVAPVHALTDDDELLYTHRGYGHLLARGVDVETVLADMRYRTTGSNRGFGGVLHANDPERGIPGRNGVFGTRFSIASGLGLSKWLQDEDGAVLCFYGEAAGTRGPLFEALNCMALWDLPVVLVAENNGYSVSSRTEELYAPGDMTTFADGFDVPRTAVDGNDADEVYEAAAGALDRARRGDGPTMIEGLTYRVPGHIPSDDERYRDPSEVEEARARDPVPRFESRLRDEGLLAEEEVADLREELTAEIRAAMDAAAAAPEPTVEQATQYVYYDERGGR